MAEPVYGARYLKPAGSDAGAATIVVYSSAPSSSSGAADSRRSSSPSGRSRRRCSGPAASGRPSAQLSLLVDDRVDRDRGLAGLPVADDELALAAADRRHGVDRLDARHQRLLDALPLDDRRRLQLQGAARLGLDVAEAVDRVAERVDDPAEEAVADRDREDLAGAADLLALLDAAELAEDDDADLADVEVQRQAERAVLEAQQLVGHDAGQALDAGDAVAGLADPPDLLAGGRAGVVGLDERVQGVPDLLGTDRELRHGWASLLSCVRVLLWSLWCRVRTASASWADSSTAVSRRAGGGRRRAGRHRAVDELAADLRPACRR